MASTPDSAPSQSSNSTSSSDTPNPSPPPPSDASPPPPENKSPPPSPQPPSSPPPSPPPPKKNESPLPSPSSPPPSPPASIKSPPEGSASPPPSTPQSPPATNVPEPATPAVPAVEFSPPAPVEAGVALSPPAAAAQTPKSRSVASSPTLSPDSSSSSSSSSGAGILAGLGLGAVIIILFLIACIVCMCRRKGKKKTYYMDPMHGPSKGGQHWNSAQDHVVKLPPQPNGGGGWGPPPPQSGSGEYSSGYSGNHSTPQRRPSMTNMNLGFSQSQFSYDELASATNGFSQTNLLGQGGFGYVHKGVLPNGQEVAVKSLKSGSGQGEREFQAEVEIISRVHHRHLVSLVGYCIASEQRMLVYEFVPNSTLEFHLHAKELPVMDWGTRLRIAIGSAKGLAYLHEDCHPRIIHRDIKTANILLDNNYEAMVADFGLAKLSSDNYTHVSTRVMGTFGYLAPEYASSGKLTEKSDVFSFGVMLLELITGRKPVDPTSKYMEDSLVDWARPRMAKAMEDGSYHEFVDLRLEDNFNPQEMTRMVAAAAASIRHSARRRPKMSQIVRTLEGDSSSLDDLNDGPGAKSNQSSAFGMTQSYDTSAYNADMMKFRKMVLDTQEYSSGETNKYGPKPSSDL